MDRWKGIEFTEEEEEHVVPLSIPEEHKEAESEALQFCLICKVWKDDSFNFLAFKSTMLNIWKTRGGVEILDLGPNLFSVVAQILGDYMGKYEDWDSFSEARWGQFLRIRVRLDLRKPLRRGMLVQLKENKKSKVFFKFEKLLNFCYICGRLGHVMKTCPDIEGDIDEGEVESLPYGDVRNAPEEVSDNQVAIHHEKTEKRRAEHELDFIQKSLERVEINSKPAEEEVNSHSTVENKQIKEGEEISIITRKKWKRRARENVANNEENFSLPNEKRKIDSMEEDMSKSISVLHLGRMHSDHSPLRICWTRSLQEGENRHEKLFRFEKAWIDDRRFTSCIANAWYRVGASCVERLDTTKEALIMLEKDVGSQYSQMKRFEKRI
ncbi:Zinc finger, CCHC-type [Sesbania bispinosa]|nr:Zinc finger, CCHC-type [Sesbania bispinosa]